MGPNSGIESEDNSNQSNPIQQTIFDFGQNLEEINQQQQLVDEEEQQEYNQSFVDEEDDEANSQISNASSENMQAVYNPDTDQMDILQQKLLI